MPLCLWSVVWPPPGCKKIIPELFSCKPVCVLIYIWQWELESSGFTHCRSSKSNWGPKSLITSVSYLPFNKMFFSDLSIFQEILFKIQKLSQGCLLTKQICFCLLGHLLSGIYPSKESFVKTSWEYIHCEFFFPKSNIIIKPSRNRNY